MWREAMPSNTLVADYNIARKTFTIAQTNLIAGIDRQLALAGLGEGKRRAFTLLRKATAEASERVLKTIESVERVEDQINLFRDTAILTVPAMMIGFLGGQKYVATIVVDLERKKTADARAKAIATKELRKRITLKCAQQFRAQSPDKKLTSSGLATQVLPDVETAIKNHNFESAQTLKTPSHQTIVNYLEADKSPAG
jgi:hypothetical protein